ncbi:MAG: Mut7-C RNAse domain-containing protein [Bryobacteraceae bacterium]
MKQVIFRFYAELNDFLPPEKRMTAFPFSFDGKQSVKHLIEALGVPHTQVDLVLINGLSARFAEKPADGDRISVYPMFESFDVAPVSRVRPRPLRVTRFVADAHLGRLAAYLRMLGFDTLYRNDFQDDELAAISASGRRILLTRDRDLLKRRAVTHGHFVRETSARLQLAEVVSRFDLSGSIKPFTRCMKCNRLLHRAGQLTRCRDCGNLYWEGSHHSRMQRLIAQVVGRVKHGVS